MTIMVTRQTLGYAARVFLLALLGYSSPVVADAPAPVDAATACIYSFTPASAIVPAEGGTGSISVTVGPGCLWSAASFDSFVTITSGGSSGFGSRTVEYAVAPNSGATSRVAGLSVADTEYTISQHGT